MARTCLRQFWSRPNSGHLSVAALVQEFGRSSKLRSIEKSTEDHLAPKGERLRKGTLAAIVQVRSQSFPWHQKISTQKTKVLKVLTGGILQPPPDLFSVSGILFAKIAEHGLLFKRDVPTIYDNDEDCEQRQGHQRAAKSGDT